jgi:hypothetical protein
MNALHRKSSMSKVQRASSIILVIPAKAGIQGNLAAGFRPSPE